MAHDPHAFTKAIVMNAIDEVAVLYQDGYYGQRPFVELIAEKIEADLGQHIDALVQERDRFKHLWELEAKRANEFTTQVLKSNQSYLAAVSERDLLRTSLLEAQTDLYSAANNAGDPFGSKPAEMPVRMDERDYTCTMPTVEQHAVAAAEKIKAILAAPFHDQDSNA